MKQDFNFLGFTINIRKFLLTLAIFCGVVIVLMLVHMFITPISWYGFLMGCAFLLAVVIACDLAKYRDLNDDFPYDLIWWVFPFSIIGARTAFVLNNLELYNDFWDMIAVWNGGLSILGGVMGGAVGLIICCLIHKKNIFSAMDICSPVLILGQSIGRWGNFINAEVYGWEVTNKALQWFPFAVKIGNHWHLANFFYESVLNFGGFVGLLYLLRNTKQKGLVSCAYLMFYGFIRFFLEQLRDKQFILYIPGTNIAWSMLTSAIMFFVGAIGLLTIFIVKRVKQRKSMQ